MAVIVFCPMEIERKAVARALRQADMHEVRVIQTGIGKAAVLRALADAAAVQDREPEKVGGTHGTLMILAGACGGLILTQDVPRIAAVIDEHGGRWTPRFSDPAGVTLVAVDQVVATPAEKAAVAARTGASIVDMETHAFAAECQRRGVPWAVVRGVSDTPEETLPAEVIRWVKPDGGTYAARAAWDLLCKPLLVPHIAGVVRRANRVLPLVGARVVEIARGWTSQGAGSPAIPPDDVTSSVVPLPIPRAVPLVLLFGGTFDPPHLGHVQLPQRVRSVLEARDDCAGAAWIVYVPAATSPHKLDRPMAADDDRVAMLQIASRGVERTAIWVDEIARSKDSGSPSFTVETLERARGWLDARGDAATKLRLLIGADQASAFHRWREPRRIIELAEPVVMTRGESGSNPSLILAALRATGFWSATEVEEWGGRIVPVGRIDASATEIRRAIAGGNAAAAVGMLPPGMVEFIRERGLYGSSEPR